MRKNARKIVIIKCCFCGKDVRKFKKEYDRQTIKRGQVKFYCDKKCSYQDNQTAQRLAEYAKSHPYEMYHRMVNSPNFSYRTEDSLSPFRRYIRKIKQRSKTLKTLKECQVNIDAEYLKSIWEQQNGICPYTNIKMSLRDYSQPSNPSSASLDRIDSSKGYVQGNVEFVCMSVNFAKNDFSKEEMLSFFKQIVNSTDKNIG